MSTSLTLTVSMMKTSEEFSGLQILCQLLPSLSSHGSSRGSLKIYPRWHWDIGKEKENVTIGSLKHGLLSVNIQDSFFMIHFSYKSIILQIWADLCLLFSKSVIMDQRYKFKRLNLFLSTTVQTRRESMVSSGRWVDLTFFYLIFLFFFFRCVASQLVGMSVSHCGTFLEISQ